MIDLLTYLLFNFNSDIAWRGWAIPTATDIAFALGILSLLGSRVPIALKLFLTALAIFDDIGAIIIIAAFYTANIAWIWLLLAIGCVFVLWLLNRIAVKSLTAYLLVGLLLWFCMLMSGIHAVIAGVILAFAIPLGDPTSLARSPLRRLEHHLHPWVAYGILPLFGFANAGISFAGLGLAHLLNPVTLGIGLGLFLGKLVGVMSALIVAIKTKLVPKPEGASWNHIIGICLLCGVGFTMSLFIGSLAFEGVMDDYVPMVRLGVLSGSLLSGVLGYLVLRASHKKSLKITI